MNSEEFIKQLAAMGNKLTDQKRLEDILQDLINFATENNVLVAKQISPIPFPAVKMAPFHDNVGIIMSKQVILLYQDNVDLFFIGAIVHELGHLLTMKFDGEYDFLGWEYVLFLHLGLTKEEFLLANKDYVVGIKDINPFKELSAEEADKVIEDRVEKAKLLGLVSNENLPLNIRGK